MPWPRMLLRLVSTAAFILNANAEVVQFFYNQQVDTCNWGTNSYKVGNNTLSGGLCAYVSSIDRIYACPAPDLACWTYGMRCANNNNNDAGANQIKCDKNKGTWCCSSQEICTSGKTQINVCVSQFTSYNANIDVAAAQAAEFSATPLSAISTTIVNAIPVVVAVSTFTVASLGSSSTSTSTSTIVQVVTAITSIEASATAKTTLLSSSQTSNPSSGIIAGIVAGGLGGLAMILGTVVYLVKARQRQQQQQREKRPPSPPSSIDTERAMIGLEVNTNPARRGYPVAHEKDSSPTSHAKRETSVSEAQIHSIQARAELENHRRSMVALRRYGTYEMQ